MRYMVEGWMFERNPDVQFGIIVAQGMTNTPTMPEDDSRLTASEKGISEKYVPEGLKTHPDFVVYREALLNVGINPNKFGHSVEAMTKRILKGGRLPRINSLVDLCNAISLRHTVSLGGHDLKDIRADLSVRLSVEGDRYLPFGETEFEDVPAGEVVFTSGSEIQTRQWLWRQSELGKMTMDTSDVFFQLVGFGGVHAEKLDQAMEELEETVHARFGGTVRRFIVNKRNTSIEF